MGNHFNQKISTRYIALIVVIFIGLSALAYTAKVRQIRGDSIFSLLVAQTIIQDGSIKLNKYSYMDHYDLKWFNGNLYSFSPIGPPLLSIPAVFIMNRMGMDLSRPEDIIKGQVALMTLFNPVIFILLFLIGRHFVPDRDALIISLVTYLGSGLSSTLNTAFWSHNYGMIITLVIILMFARDETGHGKAPNPYALGILLFLDYIMRPSYSVFILAVFAYLLSRNRRLFIRTAVTSFILLMGFVASSYMEYGLLLPPYYTINQMNGNFLKTLYVVLFSPSRGLFIYLPYMLLVAAGTVYYFKRLKGNRLFLFACLLAALNISLISAYGFWHGGHCYGPRLLLDAFPAYVLLTFILWRHISPNWAVKLKRVACISYIALGAVAIWIHSYQGLYNEWTFKWNLYPPLKADPYRMVLDWRHPQIFSTGESLRDKVLWFYGYDKSYSLVYDLVVDHDKKILISFDLTRADGYVNRGKYHLVSGREDKALEDFDRAIFLFPIKPDPLYYRGRIRLKRGQNENAIEDFTRYLFYNSTNVQAYVDRGAAYDNTGRYDLALADYIEATALAGNSDDVLLRTLFLKRGIDHFRTGDYTQAVTDLKTATKNGASTSEAYHYIAASYYANRQFHDAVEAYANIVSLFTTDEKARLMLINSMRKNADTDMGAVLNELKEFMVSNSSPDFIRTISRHYLGMETRSEDNIILEAENSGNPALICHTYYLLAEQRLMHGSTVGARSLLKKGENACPTDMPEYYLSRSLLNWLGR